MRLSILFTVCFLMVFSNCARVSSPSGGAKDTLPPIVIKTKPTYETKNFNAKRIQFKFNEYIKLNNIYKKIVVSPPLKYRLEIKPLGTPTKKITLKIKDTLRKNTTYVFNFGNSIVDNNESNPLKNFKYVFSTGNVIDSLKLIGSVAYAASRSMAKNITVALYHADSTYTDSIIYKAKPVYIGNSMDTVTFQLTHLRAGKYYMVALADSNGDYQYQPKKERIGFHKKPIQIPNDTVYKIKLFKEIPPFKVVRPIEQMKGKIFIGYKGNWSGTQIKITPPKPKKFKHFFEYSKKHDTIVLWHNAPAKDSLFVHIRGKKVDSIYRVKLRLSKQDTVLKIKSNISGVLHPRDTFTFVANHPITVIDTSKIHIFDKDTVLVPFKYDITPQKKEIKFQFKTQAKSKYYIQAMPKGFIDFYGFENDTIMQEVSTKDSEDYAILNLQFKNINTKAAIWATLTDQAGKKIFARKMLQKDRSVLFENLLPQTYYVELLIDENNNGKWDTGDFLKKIQAEEIIYFQKPLKLRPNWELTEIMDAKNTVYKEIKGKKGDMEREFDF